MPPVNEIQMMSEFIAKFNAYEKILVERNSNGFNEECYNLTIYLVENIPAVISLIEKAGLIENVEHFDSLQNQTEKIELSKALQEITKVLNSTKDYSISYVNFRENKVLSDLYRNTLASLNAVLAKL
jgi:hypothetical protein